jgi:hypothetical protein
MQNGQRFLVSRKIFQIADAQDAKKGAKFCFTAALGVILHFVLPRTMVVEVEPYSFVLRLSAPR